MNLEDMLKQHQAWLDKAHTSLVSAKVAASGLAVSAGIEQQRVEELKARIAELAAQKDQTIQRTIQRYDAAIADLNGELARLVAEQSRNLAAAQAAAAAEAAEKPQSPTTAEPAAPAAEKPLGLTTAQPAAPAPGKPQSLTTAAPAMKNPSRKAAVSAAKAKAKK
jgi:peptidoglycan DL-endopeptidase CwlO